MRKRARFGSLHCAAVAVTLIVMTAFGSAAFAQQAQTSVRSWTGTIDWWIPNRYGREGGQFDVSIDYDGKGNLKGQMVGDEYTERVYPCGRQTTLTPAKSSASLVGRYTPGRNTMSLAVSNQQAQQGLYSFPSGCAGGTAYSLPFGGGGPLHDPALAQLLNSLTVRADGSVDASGEWPVSSSQDPATWHMKLTLNTVSEVVPRG